MDDFELRNTIINALSMMVTAMQDLEMAVPDPYQPIEARDTEAEEKTELDSAGYPHNPAIHSENKTKSAKGIWRRKKGVSAATVRKIQEESAPPLPPDSELPPIPPSQETPPPPPLKQWTFAEFIPAVSRKGVTQEQLREVLQVHNIKDTIELATKPPEILSRIAEDLELND